METIVRWKVNFNLSKSCYPPSSTNSIKNRIKKKPSKCADEKSETRYNQI